MKTQPRKRRNETQKKRDKTNHLPPPKKQVPPSDFSCTDTDNRHVPTYLHLGIWGGYAV